MENFEFVFNCVNKYDCNETRKIIDFNSASDGERLAD